MHKLFKKIRKCTVHMILYLGDFEENNLKKQLKSRNVLKNAQSLYISNDKFNCYYD